MNLNACLYFVYCIFSPPDVVALIFFVFSDHINPFEFEPDFLRSALPCLEIFRLIFYCYKVVK